MILQGGSPTLIIANSGPLFLESSELLSWPEQARWPLLLLVVSSPSVLEATSASLRLCTPGLSCVARMLSGVALCGLQKALHWMCPACWEYDLTVSKSPRPG